MSKLTPKIEVEKPPESALQFRVRLGGWFGRRDLWTAAKAGMLSVLLHGFALILAMILNLSTNIVEMQIEWSDEPLTGIGSAVQIATDPNPASEDDKEREADKETADNERVSRAKPEETQPEPQDEPQPVAVVEPPAPTWEALEAQKKKAEARKLRHEKRQRRKALERTLQPALAALTASSTAALKDELETDEPDANVSREALTQKATLLSAALSSGARPQVLGEAKPGHVGSELPGLAAFGPGNARLIVLIRNDRLRGSAYQDNVRELLKKFPDYQIALQKSGIDPVDTLDALLIATTNPKDYTQNFLAVRHTIDDRILKVTLSHSFPVKLDWTMHNGRPLGTPKRGKKAKNSKSGVYDRVIYLAEPGLTLFLQEPLLDALDKPASLPPNPNATPEDALANRSMLETLTAIESVDGSLEAEAAIFVMVKGIKSMSFGAGLPELPAPISLTGSLTPVANPRLIMNLEFETEALAQEFEAGWPAFVDAVGNLGIPGLGTMLGGLEMSREGAHIYSDGELSGFFVSLVLAYAVSALPELKLTP